MTRSKGSSRRAPRVLVVDDVEDNRNMYALYLEHAGLKVDVAADGREGLARAFAQRPDVIVMDLTMPTMDGWSAIRSLKGDPRTASVPVIALTGHIAKGKEQEARAAGCDTYLLKPCLPQELLAEIHRQLGSRPSTSQLS